jgi:hypothetical protein
MLIRCSLLNSSKQYRLLKERRRRRQPQRGHAPATTTTHSCRRRAGRPTESQPPRGRRWMLLVALPGHARTHSLDLSDQHAASTTDTGRPLPPPHYCSSCGSKCSPSKQTISLTDPAGPMDVLVLSPLCRAIIRASSPSVDCRWPTTNTKQGHAQELSRDDTIITGN